MLGNRSASMAFIFITILIDVIGVGIIIPVAPPLVKELTGESISDSSIYVGVLFAAYALMSFLFSPLLGTLSDTFGRRPILLISLFGLGVDYLIHALAPNIEWLFVGRILAGIAGASFTVASAYIADISKPEEKAKNFGMMGAAFGLGFIIGPLIGSFFAMEWGLRAPFYAAAVLSLLNFFYGLLVIPESFPKEKRRKFEFKNANPIGSLLHLKKYPVLIGLVFSFFFLHLAGNTMPAIWVLFCGYQFGWDEKDIMIGVTLAVVGLFVVIVQAGLVGKSVKLLGEKNTVIVGYIFWSIGMSLFAFADEVWMLFVFMIPYCLGGIAGPTLQGIMSNQVSDKEQGELQGALTSLMSVTSFITPLVMVYVFHHFTREDAEIEFAGAPFVLASIFMLFSMIIAFRSIYKRKELFVKKEANSQISDEIKTVE